MKKREIPIVEDRKVDINERVEPKKLNPHKIDKDYINKKKGLEKKRLEENTIIKERTEVEKEIIKKEFVKDDKIEKVEVEEIKPTYYTSLPKNYEDVIKKNITIEITEKEIDIFNELKKRDRKNKKKTKI